MNAQLRFGVESEFAFPTECKMSQLGSPRIAASELPTPDDRRRTYASPNDLMRYFRLHPHEEPCFKRAVIPSFDSRLRNGTLKATWDDGYPINLSTATIAGYTPEWAEKSAPQNQQNEQTPPSS
jgi:hypothetical protein